MQLNRLEGFYWVGRTGGYAAAARAMPFAISQPAVYQQVKRLEEELELSLIERQGHAQMRLTAAGQTLFDFIEPFFGGFPAAVRAARAHAADGVLRIQAAPQVVRELLPGWLAGLRGVRPRVRVQVLERSFVDFEPLRRGEIDLIIDHVRTQAPEDIDTREVAVNFGMVVAPEGRLPPEPQLEQLAEALGDLPFVAYGRQLPHHELQQEALREFGLEPQTVVEVERAESILAMVGAGLGYSFISSMEPGLSHPGVSTASIDLDGARFPVTAAWRRRGALNTLVEQMLSLAPSLAPVSR